MPAIMTHDFFGKDVYGQLGALIGPSEEERDAFLLGNQGPDPLFYIILTYRMRPFFHLGSIMHNEKTSKLIAAMREAVDLLDEDERPVGRAYAYGFLCHYSLDRAMHPLVYAQQFAICNAGVEGLDEKSGSEVHAEIEREFDEMVLYTKTGETIGTYRPAVEILRASDEVLDVIGKMYAYVGMKAFGMFPPVDMFKCAVKDFRRVQGLFYSPTGRFRSLAVTVETGMLHRPFSFYRSMSHRDRAITESEFDNHENREWENPFTHVKSTDGFWDIYVHAQDVAFDNILAFSGESFGKKDARKMTKSLNFSGKPLEDVKREMAEKSDDANAAAASVDEAAGQPGVAEQMLAADDETTAPSES